MRRYLLSSEARFCIKCGSALEAHELDRRRRSLCPNCGWVHYPQLKVGVGVLIERDSRILLIRRSDSPFQGTWNLPAGFVEEDENPSEGASREALEETGLHVMITDLVGVYFFSDDPRGHGILIVYRGTSTDGDPRSTKEGLDPTYFSRDDVPDQLSGGGHDQAIKAWVSEE